MPFVSTCVLLLPKAMLHLAALRARVLLLPIVQKVPDIVPSEAMEAFTLDPSPTMTPLVPDVLKALHAIPPD